MARISRHLRDNVVGYVALFFALSGAAWAHGKIGSDDLRNRAVTTQKLDLGAVKAPRIADGAVTADKLAPGAAVPIAIRRPGAVFELPTNAEAGRFTPCEEGERVIGGGYELVGEGPQNDGWAVPTNRPGAQAPNFAPPPELIDLPFEATGTPTGWLVVVNNQTGSPFSFRTFVECIEVVIDEP